MEPRHKRLTIAGKTYRLRECSYDAFVRVYGPGIVGGIVLPSGVSLDSDDLREQLVKALDEYKVMRRNANEYISRRVAEGKI